MCLSTHELKKKKKKKKQRVNLEPPRPTAARLKKQKVDYEPHRPTTARLIRQAFTLGHFPYSKTQLKKL